ncbi:MAG: pyruvate formate lyase family protein, partial [Bacteroidota bacterium]
MKIGVEDVNELTDQFLSFTSIFENSYNENKALCEAKCTREQIPFYFDKPEPEDWFVGRASFAAIGFSPQVYTKRSGFGYFVEEEEIRRMQSDPGIRHENIAILEKLKDFWKKEDSVNQTRKHYPEWVKEVLPSDNWTGESGIAFPLYRMAGTQLNFNALVDKGISGLKNEIQLKAGKGKDSRKKELYEAMIYALDTFTLLCDTYINHLRDKQPDEKVKIIIDSLKVVRTGKPENLHQAIQLFYLYNVLSGSQNYGRIDDFLGDFLVRDVESGMLNEKKAKEYFVSLYRIMESRGTVYDGRAIIGGRGRRDEKSADKLALVAMRAISESDTLLPQLTLRFYEGQNPDLYNTAIKVIGNGCVYPMLYNDDVNIPSVSNAFDVNEKEAEHYIPYGCGEYTIYHRSADSPNGIINLAKALEVLIHAGRDPVSGKKMGLDTEVKSINNFEELLTLYKKQVEYHLDALAYQQRLEYEVASEISPFLYFSILYDSCVEKGKSIYDGGIDYLGGTMETYGNTVAADSLYAIKKTVFEDKLFSFEQLALMLNENFDGFEKERHILRNLPKYGNDHTEVDDLYCDLHDHI